MNFVSSYVKITWQVRVWAPVLFLRGQWMARAQIPALGRFQSLGGGRQWIFRPTELERFEWIS